MIKWIMDVKDLNQIGELFDAKLSTQLEQFESDIEGKMLTWKLEIVNSVDTLAKEIRDERESRDISSNQISGNTRRIEKLEKKVFGV